MRLNKVPLKAWRHLEMMLYQELIITVVVAVVVVAVVAVDVVVFQ